VNRRSEQVVTVFGSGRPGPEDPQYASARALGAALAEQGWVICTGGYAGVMEAVSRGAKEAGGRTIGVTHKTSSSRANPWVDEEIRVGNWQERLFELIARGNGYVACPGGTGTLVELAVVWEMLNKRLMRPKPMIVLGQFWQPVIECVREIETGNGLRWDERNGDMIYAAATPADAVDFLTASFNAADTTPDRKRVRRRKNSSR
jgi:uncharacterized protein (TIGR00730 family)